jgi:hypothetical protein
MAVAIKNTETIKASTIATIRDLAGNFIMWGVKSNTTADTYAVRCKKSGDRAIWFCDCKAAKFGFRNCKNGKCAHINAVVSMLQARSAHKKEMAELEKEQAAAVASAEMQLADERKAIPSVQFEDWGDCDNERAGRAASKAEAFEQVREEVAAIESLQREEQLVEAALIAPEILGEVAQDMEQHLEDSELAPWDDPAWNALSEQEQDQAYRNLYSGDYYDYAA